MTKGKAHNTHIKEKKKQTANGKCCHLRGVVFLGPSGLGLPPGSGVPGGWEVGRMAGDLLVLLGTTSLLGFVNLRLLPPIRYDLGSF